MGENESGIKTDIVEEMMTPKDEEVQFYLEEMQKMNNQMIDMQRELNRALMESRRVQAELKQSEERKIELEASEKAGRARLDFMSRMSHDLRTPMNVIMGLTAATLDEADNPEAVRENLSHIRTASDFMLGLVNDILDMTKAENGNIVLNLEPYSYRKFAMEMRTMFQAQCTAKNITLQVKESSFDPTVMADKMRIKQIFFNILSNAVKYTPSGGSIYIGTYNVKTDELKKQISMEYRIADTGIGMSEEFKEHVFEPFAQEDNEVSAELRGSGLGLSIAKHLVEQMGGTIQIESRKGEGTTVSVVMTFDLAEEESTQKDKENQGEEFIKNLQGKLILLVEDHPLNAQIARKMLEKEKMNVLYAENGRIAVELFKASLMGSIDAILMDIRMPEMSGIEATKAIRALDREDAASVPIIAMSANAYPEDIQESLSAGMNEHLEKPVKPAVLYETLEKYTREAKS